MAIGTTATPSRVRDRLRLAGADHRVGRPAIQVAGATIGYGAHVVLRDVDWSVAPGEFVGLVGPSGVGKTTLLRALSGQADVHRGQLEVAGERPRRGRPPRGIGYVPQLDTVDREFPLTVRQVVLSGRADRSSWGPWYRRDERRHADRVLERLGIGGLADRSLDQLSGGQLQRMYLARALVRDSQVLLLDEPTSGVDPATRCEVLDLLHELHADGLTIVLTTHDLNFVAVHLPRVACLAGGIVADGSPAETLTGEVLSRTYGTPMRVLRDREQVVVVDAPEPDSQPTSGGVAR